MKLSESVMKLKLVMLLLSWMMLLLLLSLIDWSSGMMLGSLILSFLPQTADVAVQEEERGWNGLIIDSRLLLLLR